MYLKDYQKICEEGGLNGTNLISEIYLEQAKERAIQMVLAQKNMDRLGDKVSPNIHKKMQEWIKLQDEKRVAYMFEALDYAEGMRGLSKEWDAHLRRKWREWGMDEPTY